MKILLVDFYDSFTYNLAHYLEPLCDEVDVIRDNEPGLPENTKTLNKILEMYSGKIPILGVCLGMQGIVQFLGGRLAQKKSILHGKPVQLITFHYMCILISAALLLTHFSVFI